mmetsp:Transcript_28118/g.39549  ORF Transcript_28118/g.39549 Transcript_28118/m.39549 type:complete len:185 (-) Transcript_28118:272-826(-)
MNNNFRITGILCLWGVFFAALCCQADGFSVSPSSQRFNGARQSFIGTELQMAWYKPRSIRKAVVGSLQVDKVKHPNGNFHYDDGSAALTVGESSSLLTPSQSTYTVPGIGSDWPTFIPTKTETRLMHTTNNTKLGESSSNVLKIILNAAIRICYLILGPELFFRLLQFCKLILSVQRRRVQELR